MKRTKSKSKIEKARELAELMEKYREIEKKVKGLKDYFRSEIGEGSMDADGIVISLVHGQRTSLDRKALVNEMGDDFMSKFERVTEFTQVKVSDERKVS